MSSRLLDARRTAKAWLCVLSGVRSAIRCLTRSSGKPQPFSRAAGRQRHASSISITATAMTTSAMYPNNDTLGERLRLYVEENFHDA